MTNALQKKYFAAANTQNGFESFFEDIFFCDKITRRYIIKGGPGTGKNSLMRKIGRDAQLSGRSVEWYYCSSDTNSLDGVVIDGSLAIFDGTAPHSYDTVLAGAVDSIINLGEYWNGELLSSHRDEIAALTAKKARAYANAYGYLSAAGELCRTADSVILTCVDYEKLRAAAARLVPRGQQLSGAGEKIRQVSAFGALGQVRFDTLESSSESRVYIEDYYGTAHLFLSELCRAALARGYTVHKSLEVPSTQKISEIFLPEVGIYYGVLRDDSVLDTEKTVNMKRFVDGERLGGVRFEYRSAMRAYDKIIDLAEQSMRAAGTLHASIEKYYILAMDFERMGNLKISLA